MNVSGTGSQGINMVQMRQFIEAKMKDVVSQANTDVGNPLGTSADFSKPAELLSELSQLKDSDPEKFKSLMSDIAKILDKAASDAGDGSIEAKIFSNMATKFKSAAETGDLTQLLPTQRGHHQGGQLASIIKDVISQANADAGNPLGDISSLTPAQLMAKLSGLRATDPEKFKTLMNDISDNLTKASNGAGGSGFESKMLADLAAKFKNAGETGDLSQLQPPPPPTMAYIASDGAITRYLSNTSGGDDSKTSLLDILNQHEKENAGAGSSSGTSSFDTTLSTIQDMLAKAFQTMMNEKKG